MKLRGIVLGAALVGACDDRHEAVDGGVALDARHDVVGDVRDGSEDVRDGSDDVRDDVVGDVRDGSVGDVIEAPDGKPPLDDAGIVEHWAARCDGAAATRPFYQYHLSTAGLDGTTPACGSLAPAGPARWISLSVDAGQSAVIRVGRDGDGPTPSLRVFDACGGACVPVRVRRDADGSQLQWWRNDTCAARVYRVAVGAAEPGVRGRFWVWPRVLATGDNARCETAEATTRVFPTPADRLGDAPSTCTPRQGPTSWYAFSVGTGDRLVARAEPVFVRLPAMARYADLHVLTDCAGTCVAPVGPSVEWMNEGAAVTARLGVTGPDPNDAVGGYTLDATVLRAPANARCETAAALVDVVAPTTVWSASGGPSCAGGSATRAVYYRATVGAGETLAVSGARGDGQQRFAVLDGCEGACLGTATADAAQADARWTNTGTTARAVIVAATGVPTANVWTHAMTAARGAPANRTRCATALRVTDGTVLTGERPVLIDGAAPCGATEETGAYYYAARVEAGDTLMVWGAGRFRLLDGCATTTCLDLDGATARDDSLVWRNESSAAREVVVAMSLPRARQNRAVDVRVAIGRPAYTMRAIPAQCEDVSAGREVRFGTTFLGSSWEALPFAMPFWGATMRAWRLTYRGGLSFAEAVTPGVLPAMSGPSGALPDATLGPFVSALSDGAAQLPFQGAMRVLTVEGARRHVTLDVRTTERRTAPYLHHQVRLYEDGAVEFHYCEVEGGAVYDASSAAVGMQGGTPLQTLAWTSGVPDAVRAGLGVRFTPR